MLKDYINQFYYLGVWSDSEYWYRTLCIPYIMDDFGNLVRA